MATSKSTASPSATVALVTGGAGDLGRAIAEELAAQGYEVQAPGRRELDVSDAASIDRWLNAHPRAGLVVHCAGILRDRMSQGMSEAEWDEVMAVNLKGAFHVTQRVLQIMSRARGGHVLFIGSNSARHGTAGQANYAAAKAGLIGLTHSLAKEYGCRDIRVNCILPGLLETKMTAHLSAEVRESVLRSHSLGRFNDCASVARFVAFLDRSMPNTSGQVFQLDSRINRWT